MKTCECGCGKPTRFALRTSNDRGHIKGQPLRFIHGHNQRWQGTLQEHFEKFFEKKPNSCWIWKGSKTSHGYGQFAINRKAKPASRLSYKLYKGPIPRGFHVCHKCDNPPCVNPEHLFVGTRKDNMQDMIKKNRHEYGEKHHNAKLTEQDVLEIRNDCRTQSVIAKDYGVSQSVISNIKFKKNWKHV